MRILLTVFCCFALPLSLAGLAHATPGDLISTVLNPDPDPGDEFGAAVTSVGNHILIGAAQDNNGGKTQSGAAYLFNGNTGSLLHTFLNPDPDTFDRFGAAVGSIGGDALVGGVSTNAVYRFEGSTGNLINTYTPPSIPDLVPALFGFSVASVGNNVLVGASHSQDGTVAQTGAAYLFDGDTGSLLQAFHNPTPDIDDQFGTSVAAVGNNVLIGARFDDTTGPDDGAVYLFDVTTGSLLHTFLTPNLDVGNGFGLSLSSIGNYALIGSPTDGSGASGAGAVYMFDADPGSSTFGDLTHSFLNPTPIPNDNFGFSAQNIGGNVLIGAFNDDQGATDSGIAYLFDGQPLSPTFGDLLVTFENPQPGQGDFFGYSVTGVGDRILVGAFFDDTDATNAGAAYLFEGAQQTEVPEPSTLLLLGTGLVGLVGYGRRKRKA